MPNNIEILRRARGLSQKDLADRMGAFPQEVQRLEKGKRTLNQDWIERFALGLGANVSALLEMQFDDLEAAKAYLSELDAISGNLGETAGTLSDQGRSFDPTPDRWAIDDQANADYQRLCLERIVRDMALIAAGRTVDIDPESVEKLVNLLMATAAAIPDRDRLAAQVRPGCEAVLVEFLREIKAPPACIARLQVVLAPAAELILLVLAPAAENGRKRRAKADEAT